MLACSGRVYRGVCNQVKEREMQFEYKKITFSADTINKKIKNYLNEQGSEGWELITVIPLVSVCNSRNITSYLFILKRAIIK